MQHKVLCHLQVTKDFVLHYCSKMCGWMSKRVYVFAQHGNWNQALHFKCEKWMSLYIWIIHCVLDWVMLMYGLLCIVINTIFNMFNGSFCICLFIFSVLQFFITFFFWIKAEAKEKKMFSRNMAIEIKHYISTAFECSQQKVPFNGTWTCIKTMGTNWYRFVYLEWKRPFSHSWLLQ